MSRIIATTMGFACIISCLVGFFGYLTFAEHTNSLINSDGIILKANYYKAIEVTIV